MTRFADELFADLMREHGQELEILDRPQPREAIRRPLTARPRPPRPLTGHPRRPRRQPGWLAPVAAATGVTLAVGLAVVLGSRVHHVRHTGRVTDSRAETAYVLNAYQGTVAPISPVTGKLGKPVRVGPRGSVIGHGKRRLKASRIAQDLILPDGTTNYALYLRGRGKGATEMLRRTSLVTGEAGPPIQVGRPASVVITPDGRTAYLNYSGLHESTVRPVSLATGTVGKPILRAPRALTPWITLTMAPDGRTIYAPYYRVGRVIPISTATNTPGKPIPVPGAWGAVAFTRDGRTAFVIGRRKGAGQTVTPISTATNTPGRAIIIEPHAGQLIFAPDGKTVYNVDFPGTSVTPISTRTGRAGKPILLHGGHGASNMLITPDGRTLYIGGQGEVTPVSLATGTVGKSLTVPGAPLNLVITPDGRTIYASSATVGDLQIVTPISTATGAAGKPVRTTAPTIDVLIPGAQNAL
jgi:DNA-binding beta-propeller fold protein YncE